MRGPRRGEKSSWGRGQSTLLGIVLLIGIVAIGSIALFLVATGMLTDIEQDSENERVEQAFVEFGQQMAAASSDDDNSRSVDLEAGGQGAVVMTDTGSLTIEGGNVSETIPIGAVEYTADDDTKIAYQAGGVFRETGNQTRVVSAPPVEYDNESDTLSFPVVKTRDEAHLDSGSVDVTHYETDPHEETDHVVNDTVTLEIESEYYRGWAQYFVNEFGEMSVREVVPLEGEKGLVRVEVGIQNLDNAFADAVGHSEEGLTMNASSAVDPEDSNSTHDYDPIDSTIESHLDDVSGEDAVDLADNELDNGMYYSEGAIINDSDDSLTLDLSDGDVTIVVDGDLVLNGGDIDLEGADSGEAYVYTNGSVFISNNAHVNRNGDPRNMQIYGSSNSHLWLQGGNTEYVGTYFAPGESTVPPNPPEEAHDFPDCGIEDDVCIGTGNPTIKGSVVANNISLDQSGNVVYDDRLESYDPDLYPDGIVEPPEITYLNVAEHKVDVEGN